MTFSIVLEIFLPTKNSVLWIEIHPQTHDNTTDPTVSETAFWHTGWIGHIVLISENNFAAINTFDFVKAYIPKDEN